MYNFRYFIIKDIGIENKQYNYQNKVIQRIINGF